jgi:signal transduction histidine kinase
VDLYTTLNQSSEREVAVGLDYLRYLGVEWSPHPAAEEGRREYERIWKKLGSRAIEQLIDLPLMSDPASIATLDVLTKVLSPAFFTDANLASLVVCWMVNLSLEHGSSDGSSVAYVCLGMIAGPNFGNYKAGFRFGQLGYELVEKRGLKRFQARTYMLFGGYVMPWTKHVRTCRDLVHRALEVANKIGDLTFAAYSYNNLNTNLLAAGDPLPAVQREAERGLEFAQKARFGLVIDIITPQLGLIRILRGLTPKFGSFDDEEFDELRFERHLASDPAALPGCYYWIRKLQARFFAGDYASAIDASFRAQQLLWTAPSQFAIAEYHFYSALSRAASCDSGFPDRQHLSSEALAKEEHLETLAAHYRQLEVWAENCPENFGDRAALVAGEIARLEGRDFQAMRLYEESIRLARTNGFVHNEALANELAAHFYMARGFEKIAGTYLKDARYCYLRWGAAGKVRQLERLYSHLREEERAPGPTCTIGAPVEHLDLATVIKVSQTVSGEIVLEKLIDTLVCTAVEHAGAERGLLIFPQGVELRVEAEAVTSGDTVTMHRRGASTAAGLAESIVHYVARTQESVILDDASAQNPFSTDPYIRRHHARSIFCLPLINQAKLIALLYLENNLTPHVFTPTRIAVLKLLASQAAISLENTRLYRGLEEAQAELAHVTRVATLGELTASIAHEISQPLGAVVNNASACLRWLTAHNLEEARQSASLVIAEGHRAGEIISRVRALAKKAPPQKDWLDINETIGEVIAMARSAVQRNRISLQTQLANDLPLISGDRIQLQQVILNLLINAIEAMGEVSGGQRELWVSSQKFTEAPGLGPCALQTAEAEEDVLPARALAEAEGNHVLIGVRDSGPGLDPKGLDRLFDAFYTTKPQGLGMGLAISRSIIEAHGGRLWAKANAPRGTVFQFTLPDRDERMS